MMVIVASAARRPHAVIRRGIDGVGPPSSHREMPMPSATSGETRRGNASSKSRLRTAIPSAACSRLAGTDSSVLASEPQSRDDADDPTGLSSCPSR